MDKESVMETVTTVGSTVAVTTPLWLQEVDPYVRFSVALLGAVWIVVQLYYKLKNERRKYRD